MSRLADHRNESGGRWLNMADDELFDGRYGADLPTLARKGDLLGVWEPILDNRDAIVGGRFHPAVPAQQYGARAASWIDRQARRAAQLARDAAAPEEPF